MRLMLVEFFPTALRRTESSMLFPFLQGLAREHGVETRWLCFGGDPGRRSSSGRLTDDARSFGAHLDDFRPSHVVASAPLPEAMAGLAAGRAPAPRVLAMPTIGNLTAPEFRDLFSKEVRARRHFARCAWFLDWLGIAGSPWEARFIVDEVVPDYQVVMANEAARASRAHITIAGGVLCGNRRTLTDNPLFRRVVLPPPAGSPPGTRGSHHGCSFCCSERVSLTARGADILPSIERQFRRILETAGEGGRDKRIYELYDIHAFWRFDEVFEVILRLGLPPSLFLFNPRVDDILRVRKRIERALPRLAAAGHRVHIMSMGLENFSPREQARFNKGLTVAQLDELIALSDAWARDWPTAINAFKGGQDKVEMGFILFTPWTTLADLRLNLEGATARHFPAYGPWLYSTLYLRETMPLYLLARAEGKILTDRFPDRAQLYRIHRTEGDPRGVVPWRFKDPRVADLFALLVRVCAADLEGSESPFFAGDAEFALVSRLYAEANAAGEASPLALAKALVEVLKLARPPRGRAALLRAAVRRVVRRAPRAGGAAGPAAGPVLWARAVQDVVRRLGVERPAALADVSFESVEKVALPDCRAVRLKLAVAGRPLQVDLLDGHAEGPSFLRSRCFRAVYSARTPITSAHERDALALLLDLFDAQLEGART